MDPKGKVIPVTGASSGIGLASARELVREGGRVILAAAAKAAVLAFSDAPRAPSKEPRSMGKVSAYEWRAPSA